MARRSITEDRMHELTRLVSEAVDELDPRDMSAHARIPKAKRAIKDVDRLIASLDTMAGWSDAIEMLRRLKQHLIVLSFKN